MKPSSLSLFRSAFLLILKLVVAVSGLQAQMPALWKPTVQVSEPVQVVIYSLDPAHAEEVLALAEKCKGKRQFLPAFRPFFTDSIFSDAEPLQADLPRGLYLRCERYGNPVKNVVYRLEQKMTVNANLARLGKTHYLLLADRSGKPLPNAQVHLAGEPLKWDGFIQGYVLPDHKPGKEQWIKIQTAEETAWLHPSYSRETRTTSGNIHHLREEYPELKFNTPRQSFCYMATDKPLYRRGDTVKIKVFASGKNNRPLNKPLDLHFIDYYDKNKIKTLQPDPQRPGVFIYHWALPDSLANDRSYDLVASGFSKKIKTVATFTLEDYQLDEARFSLELEKNPLPKGELPVIMCTATDANELPVPDARVNFSLMPLYVHKGYHTAVLLPDTLCTFIGFTGSDGKLRIEVPDSSLPPANVHLKAVVQFTAPNGEQSKDSLSFEYDSRKVKRYSLRDSAGTILAACDNCLPGDSARLVSKNSQYRPDLTDKRIPLPFSEKISPWTNYYELFDPGKKVADVSLTIEYTVEINGWRRADSLFAEVSNPSGLPVKLSLFLDEKQIWEGNQNSSLHQYSFPAAGEGKYLLKADYFYGGNEHGNNAALLNLEKKLDIEIVQPSEINPGEKSSITVKVKDPYGRPVAGADLTASAINAQIIQSNEPRLDWKGQAPFNLKMKEDRYSHKKPEGTWTKQIVKSKRIKTSLDTSLTRRFLNPQEEMVSLFTPIPGAQSQFAPYVSDKNYCDAIYCLQLDGGRLLINNKDPLQSMGIPASPGFHRVTVYTARYKYTSDSILLRPGYKTDVSWHSKKTSTGVSRERMNKKKWLALLTQAQEHYLRIDMQYYLESFLLSRGDEAWIIHPGVNFLGPFVPGDNLQLKNAAGRQYAMTFTGKQAWSLTDSTFALSTVKKEEIFNPAHSEGDDFTFCPGKHRPTTEETEKIIFGAVKGRKSVMQPRSVSIFFTHPELNGEFFVEKKNDTCWHFISMREYYEAGTEFRIHQMDSAGRWHCSPFFKAPQKGGLIITLHDSVMQAETQPQSLRLTHQVVELSPIHEGMGSFTGKLVNYSMPHLPRRKVLLFHEGSLMGDCIADAYGLFSFAHLAPGEYMLYTDVLGEAVGWCHKFTVKAGGNFREFYITNSCNLRNQLSIRYVNHFKTGHQRRPFRYRWRKTIHRIFPFFYPVKCPKFRSRDGDSEFQGGRGDLESRSSYRSISFNRFSINRQTPVNGELTEINFAMNTGEYADLIPGHPKSLEALNGYNSSNEAGKLLDSVGNFFLLRTDKDFGGSESFALRSRFGDVAYWQPLLITDENGEATFEVTFPENITSWKCWAAGLGPDQESGMGRTTTRAHKRAMGLLDMPRFFIEGDTCDLQGRALNYSGDSVWMQTCFIFESDTAWSPATKAGVQSIEKTEIIAGNADSLEASFLIRLENGFLDGERRKIPVLPTGIREVNGDFVVLDAGQAGVLHPEALPGEVSLSVQTSVLPSLLEAVKYLRTYPHACVEQLSSQLRALVAIREVPQAKSFSGEALVKRTIRRLERKQKTDGSFGWWEGSPVNQEMTLYAAVALKEAADAGYESKSLKAAQGWLSAHPPVTDLVSPALAFMMQRAGLDTALYLGRMRNNGSAEDYILGNLVRKNASLPYDASQLHTFAHETLKGGLFFSSASNTDIFVSSPVLTLRAYELCEGDAVMAALRKSMQLYFMESQARGQGWNTIECAEILRGLMPSFSQAQDPASPSVTMIIDGKEVKPGAGIQQIKIENKLPVMVANTSAGPVFFCLYAQGWNQKPVKNDSLFEVSTAMMQEGRPVNEITAGEPLNLVVTVKVKKESDYLLVEVPIPAACSYAGKPQNGNAFESHREYFKDRVAIYCEAMPVGTHSFTLPLEPRFTGSFTLNPVQVESMYFPVFNGRNEMRRVQVRSAPLNR